MSNILGLMAIGSHGTTIHGIDFNRPRASLLEQLGASHASKVYIDAKDGTTRHVGYTVRGEWFTLYKVSAWERTVRVRK